MAKTPPGDLLGAGERYAAVGEGLVVALGIGPTRARRLVTRDYDSEQAS